MERIEEYGSISTGPRIYERGGVGSRFGEPLSTISWRAIFAGVVVALAVQILLTTLGLAIGATTLSADATSGTARDAGIGVGIWYLISNLISVFCGGMVAGISARETTRTLGAIEGLVVWGFSLLLFLWFVTGGVQSLIGQASGMIAFDPGQMQQGQLPPVLQQDPQVAVPRETTQQIADASVAAAWIAFGTLLLAAASGTLGGILGARVNRNRMGDQPTTTATPTRTTTAASSPGPVMHPREA
jgi:hypothetical protein